MKRDRLIQLVRSAAAAEGYAFHTGEMHTVNGTLRAYPAAWLAPPVVKGHTGRTEGETTWRTVVHLMALPTGDATAETVWQILERDALEIAGSIASSPDVCAVGNVGCVPARKSLTVHGEVSVAMTLDISLWYCS